MEIAKTLLPRRAAAIGVETYHHQHQCIILHTIPAQQPPSSAHPISLAPHMPDVRKYILTGIAGFFMLIFGFPKLENDTMQEMRSWHTGQEERRKCEEELEENHKRMKQLEFLAKKKQVWKAEISMFEGEQAERLRAENHCNEQKRLSDERELIMERIRELPEGNRKQGLMIMERMPDLHEGNK